MGRVAVVTGAASGVGRATARLLVDRGWRVVGIDIQAGALDGMEAVTCDLRSPAAIEEAFATIRARHGQLDALICSAGVLRVGPLETMSLADFDVLFEVNVRAAWLCAQKALPLLRASARPPDSPSHIVFISSVALYRPKLSTGAYAATKAALSQITRVLAGEVASDGVLVNALAPGSMDTPMTQAARRSQNAKGYQISEVPPIGRKAVPDDIAHAVAMLLGPDSRFITGTTIAVDGGSAAVYVPMPSK